MMNSNEEPTQSTSSASTKPNGFRLGAKKATKNKRKKIIPFSRVVHVMKSHPHTAKAKVGAVELISHAAELFIKDLIKTCYESSPEALTYDILAMAIAQSGNKYLKQAVPKTITYREYLRLKKEREAKEQQQQQQQQQEGENHGGAADVEENAEDEEEKDDEDKEAEKNDDIVDEEPRQEDEEHGYAAGVDQEMAEDKKDKEIDKKKEDNGDNPKEKEEPIYYDHFVESKDEEDKNNNNLEEFGRVEICEESIVAYEEAIQLFH